MQFNRCFGCMKEINSYPCPHCGFDPRAQQDNYVLPCGTVLSGHYVVGKVLGQGGFGITYIGYDLSLQRRVAIKEFSPKGQAMRMAAMGSSLQWASDSASQDVRTSGMESFLREARKMAKVDGIPEIVRVRESFLENNTAYIVMDYIEGRTLLSVLKEKGPMPWEQAKEIFLPAISAMEKVHREGIVHRDLSPDNLMLTDKGIRILDLGAAKDLSSGSGASSAQVAKGGFSPMEQYTQRGGSGPWSDVYAMAATIYYTLTGVLPPNAIDRMEEDLINWKLLSQRGVPSGLLPALQKAMNVTVKGRTQSMAELLRQLEKCRVKKKLPPTNPIKPAGQKPAKEPKPVKEAKPETPRKSPVKKTEGRSTGTIWIGAAAAVVVLLGIALGFAVNAKKEVAMALPPETQAVETTVPQETTVPETTLPPETQPVPVHVMATAEDLVQFNWEERKNRPFWGQTAYKRRDVKTVTFRGSLEGVPSDAWDVSEAGDRSILAWMEGGDLLVAADGKIAPNPDASWMFAHFENMTAIDFGGCFDTSNVTSMGSMFFVCTSLTQLDVSGFDTANVTYMGGMFGSCSSLTELDVSGFDTANVTDMGGMFDGCWNLTALDVSGFDTAKVTNMGAMFCYCSSLTELDVSGFDTANVTDMGWMFDRCSSLTVLDLSGFDTANVTDMGGMFYDCSSLTELDLSGFDTANVIDMGGMFWRCSSLTELDLSGFDTANVTDMRSMFRDCSSLTELDVSGFDTANVTDMGWMFRDCSSLTELDVSGFDTANVADMYLMFFGCGSLKSLDLSNWNANKVSNMADMFEGCDQLTDLKCSDARIQSAYNRR